MITKHNILQMVETAYHALLDKKGEKAAILDISGISVICDYFLIVTGNNENHIKTLTEAVEESLHKLGKTANHKEGTSTGWVLIDFGDFIVHIFSKEGRDFYDIEHIWGDAEVVAVI